MEDAMDPASTTPATTPIDPTHERALELIEDLATQFMSDRREERRWSTIKRTALILGVLAGIALYAVLYGPLLGYTSDPSRTSVAVIPVRGLIAPEANASADTLVPLIDRACRSPVVAGVILRINSPGGAPAEAERIAAAVTRCGKPTAGVIEGIGASAAYLIAASTSRVVASRYATVGSVGAVMRTIDASEAAARLGIREQVYATSPDKAGGSLITPIAPPQAATLQALVNTVGGTFRADVLRLRDGKVNPDKILDGQVWIAEEARDLGLVDEIAVLEDFLTAAYPGLPTHGYRPQRTLQERLSMEALIKALADELETRTLSGAWR
jgi:protease IV